MAYVISDACEGTCDLACVAVCPVDAIHGAMPLRQLEALPPSERAARRLRMYIDPETCISCGACEPECPVSAIFEASAVPPEWQVFLDLDRRWTTGDDAEKNAVRAEIDQIQPRSDAT